MRRNRITRRTFSLLAVAGGIAALTYRPGKRLGEKLIPYVNPPVYPKPGDWAFYSTTCRECPAGCGMLMWHRDGRATKAEGNPLHPVNKGKLCIRGQSSVQGEYDPQRFNQVLERDLNGGWIKSTWNLALPAVKEILKNKKPVLITGLETGSLAGIMNDFASSFSAKPFYYEAFNYESLRLAGGEVYGSELIPKFNISGTDLILSFNADFIETWLSPVEYAGDFGNFHSPGSNVPGRLIYFGYSENLTAVNADEYIITQPGTHAAILYSLADRLRKKGAIRNNDLPPFIWNDLEGSTAAGGLDEELLEKIADRLSQAKAPMILAGRGNDASLDGIKTVKAAYLLNELLGNHGRIDFSSYHALSSTSYRKEIHALFSSISSGNVVIIHNTNPVYTEPGFEDYLKKASAVIYIGHTPNETSSLANWILPSSYPLEDWGDYEPWKGTVSLLQPVMRPLYNTKSAGDIFLELGGNKQPNGSFKERVRNNWNKWFLQDNTPVDNGNLKTVTSLEAIVKRSHFKKTPGTVKPDLLNFSFSYDNPVKGTNFYIDPVPSLFLYDGRLANRPWLQEIPDPVSDIVWQNRIDMNAESANSLGIQNGELVKVTSALGSIEVAVRLTPLLAAGTISIQTGQGHLAFGDTANGRGVNVFGIISIDHPGPLETVEIQKTGKIRMPVYLNPDRKQHDRDLLRHITAGEPNDILKREKITLPLPSGYSRGMDLYKPHEHKNHRWAMVVDLQRCIGCKACVAACYAENNIPVMGRRNCERGLEMAWLKVPAYFTVNDKIAFIPIPCQHCDAAPCEPVCPTYASSHTDEGLNAQVYNRCIGTRYCSNNCPYKVRRFNWKNMDHKFPETFQLNPEVTVRCRGVMEKCTFCVQRIRKTEYSAKRSNRSIRDGEITPACAQTCPTGAIVFGDLLDPGSKVSMLFDHPRRYQLLHELNTKPAVVYLKKIILNS